MAILNDLEKGPWNPKNWHPTFGSGKLRFQIPDTMSVGDKKALIAALKEKFSNQIVIPGISFSSDWESDLARPGFINLDKLKYVEFDPNIDRSHTKHENKEIFRVFIIDRRTETERNHPRPQPTPPKKKEPEKPSEAEEAIKNVATFVAELPKDIILSRWDDLLKKISQAETFDELAQNLIFQILFLAPNALNDGLVAITGALDKVTQHWEKKLGEVQKAKLEALKKGVNEAKKQSEAGNPQAARQYLVGLLLGKTLEEKQRALQDMENNPELMKLFPEWKKELQKPEFKNLLEGVQIIPKAEKPRTQITNPGPGSYTKEVTMLNDPQYTFTLNRTRSATTPPTDTFTYKMDFVIDGKAANLTHDPNGNGGHGTYILVCDGKTTTYDLVTRQVDTTDGRSVKLSRDPDKAFQDIAKYTEALKKQEEEFAKDLKTLDKEGILRTHRTEYLNPTTTPDRKKQILQELHDMGVNIEHPENSTDWDPSITAANKASDALLNPPPLARKGIVNKTQLDPHPYTLVGGGTVSGFQVYESYELLEGNVTGRRCKHTFRDKRNEDAQTDIKEFEDGAYEIEILDGQPVASGATGAQGDDPGNRKIDLKCHKDSHGKMEGTLAWIQDGFYYHCTLRDGQIAEYVCYNERNGEATKYDLTTPITLSEGDIQDTIGGFSQHVEPDKRIRDFRDPIGFPLMERLDQIQRAPTAPPTTHTLSDEKKAKYNNDIANARKELGKRRQNVFNENESRAFIQQQAQRNNNQGI